MIRMTREMRADRKPKALLVPNRVDSKNAVDPATAAAVAALAERWAPALRHDRRHVEAFAAGTWIGAQAPQAATSHDIAALAEAARALLGLASPPTPEHSDRARAMARLPA
jgi:hypothetical protein